MTGARAGWVVRHFATLPSTNEWLLAEARAGAPTRTVAVADHQSAGRGRRGRHWEAPPGRCLLVSVLLRPVAPPGDLYACTAAVALAAADACAAVADVTPEIKWPNDLMVGDAKLAGVLAEADAAARGGRAGSVAVVVGVGCNVDWDDAPGATCLAAHSDLPVAPRMLLESYLDALAPRVAPLDSPGGRRTTIAGLRARCATLGRRVRVELDRRGAIEGVARAIDDHGHLIVATDAGDVTVAAGDVVHLRPVPA